VAGTQPIPLPEGVHASTYWGLATAAGGRLFFAGSDAATGSEPWATDGLTTVRLADLRPGPDSSVGFGWDRPAFATVGDQALFIAELGSGPQLWRARGTVGDVSPLTDFEAPPAGSGFGFFDGLAEPAVAQGRLLVPLWRSDRGVEIWSSDGTAAGTFVARTIANQTSSFGGGLDRVYWSRRRDACFDATDTGVAFLAFESRDVDFDVSGLRFSDGTPGGIRTLVKRFGVAGEQYACGTLGDRIFAVGGIEPQSFGLWRSDGTTAGTSLEYGFSPYPLGFDPAFARLGSDLLFVGPSSLYAIRGASPGPLLDPPEPIEELGPAPYVSFGELRTAGALVFVAGSGGLLVSDGHAPPLALLGEPPLPEGGETAYLAWDGATLFFTSWTQSEGNELWRTDGTPGGTAPVAVLRPGPASGVPPRQNWEYFDRDGHARVAPLATGGAVFAGDDGAAGIELWVSDGSAAGTERIADLWPGPYPSAPHQLVALGGRVLFVAEHPAWGAELFATDGTAAGTALVRDLVPGRVSSQPQELVVLDGVLYFSAWTPEHGREAWRSDGTPFGTWRLTDAAPGPLSSSPSRFAKVGNRLFFVANDNIHGFELWALDLATAGKAGPPRGRPARR
jgi:ELWxxDGT repeat protein